MPVVDRFLELRDLSKAEYVELLQHWEEELEDLISNKARLWLDSGAMFGVDGEGFERINIACPRATLCRAFSQLEKALHDR